MTKTRWNDIGWSFYEENIAISFLKNVVVCHTPLYWVKYCVQSPSLLKAVCSTQRGIICYLWYYSHHSSWGHSKRSGLRVIPNMVEVPSRSWWYLCISHGTFSRMAVVIKPHRLRWNFATFCIAWSQLLNGYSAMPICAFPQPRSEDWIPANGHRA